jgi:hypothetical protein
VSHLLALLHPPPALDGESVNNNNTALDLLSAVSIVFGYVLLALLWRFVFSKKARSKRERDPPD